MKGKEYNSIYWIKVLSMFLIVLSHHAFTDAQRLDFLFPFAVDMAVPLLVICTGFLNENSFLRKLNGSNKQWYSFGNLVRKMVPILLPYILFLIVEIIYNLATGLSNVKGIVFGVFTGGWGQGAYYVPVIIQIYLLFPFISYIGRSKIRLLLCMAAVTGYCFLCSYFKLDDSLYKIIAIRYIPFAAVGCYLYNHKIKPYIPVLGALISAALIVLMNYTSYTPVVFSHWTTTSLPVIGWASCIFWLLFRIPRCPRFVKTLSNASFYIFLVQKLYLYLFDFLKPVYFFALNVCLIFAVSVLLYTLDAKFIRNQVIRFLTKNSTSRQGEQHV